MTVWFIHIDNHVIGLLSGLKWLMIRFDLETGFGSDTFTILMPHAHTYSYLHNCQNTRTDQSQQ